MAASHSWPQGLRLPKVHLGHCTATLRQGGGRQWLMGRQPLHLQLSSHQHLCQPLDSLQVSGNQACGGTFRPSPALGIPGHLSATLAASTWGSPTPSQESCVHLCPQGGLVKPFWWLLCALSKLFLPLGPRLTPSPKLQSQLAQGWPLPERLVPGGPDGPLGGGDIEAKPQKTRRSR